MRKNNNVNAFITDDITIRDFDSSNLSRYDLTKQELNPSDYGFKGTNEEFLTWVDQNLNFEELYEVPMMNALYYYPSFVTFQKEDRCKTASTTTLLYDNELEAWAVGVTGGGMDLSPHLLDTFLQLEHGVPLNIAKAISKKYSAYIKQEKHRENCLLLSEAFYELSRQFQGFHERLWP